MRCCVRSFHESRPHFLTVYTRRYPGIRESCFGVAQLSLQLGYLDQVYGGSSSSSFPCRKGESLTLVLTRCPEDQDLGVAEVWPVLLATRVVGWDSFP